MQRFFVEPYQIEEEKQCIHITGSDVNHIKNVLRMKPGEEVWISSGQEKEYHCAIESLEPEEILLQIMDIQEADYELPNRIYLFQGLPKGDKMELIIQKAVELGVYGIIPVETKRCVVKLDAKKAKKKVERWQQISESAAKQSKRMLVPEVYPVISCKDALVLAKKLDICLIPYELAKGIQDTRDFIDSIAPGKSIGIFIGPEGGFEGEEVEMAVSMGARPVTLGKRILRTETAGLAMLSVLMFHLEGRA